MILLKATTETLAVTTTSIADIDYSISYADITTTTFSPSSSEGKIITATTTTVVSSPAVSTQRQVKLISITNRHASTTNTIQVVKVIAGIQYYLTPSATLLAGETMQYIDGQGWKYYTSTGSLKVDGTIAAGSDAQIQFNGGGLMVGDPGLTYDKTNDILRLNTVSSALQMAGDFTAPITPPAGTVSIFARQIANRMMIAQVGPSGLDSALQPLLARNKVGYWNPQGNSTVLPGVFGITALTTNTGATITARNVATTSLATRMRRIGFPSAGTANSFAGARLPVAQFSCGSGSPDGSGVMIIERWVESDPAVVAGKRSFHGLTLSIATPTNVEPTTLTNAVGVCQLSTDATQWYWYGAGSSAQAAVAVGTAIGAPGGNSTTAWELAIFAPNGIANTYFLQLTNITTGVTATRTFNGAAALVPQSTTLLAYNMWATNNTTAVAVGIDICSLYIETDT